MRKRGGLSSIRGKTRGRTLSGIEEKKSEKIKIQSGSLPDAGEPGQSQQGEDSALG